jgi:hypothetical protein
MMSLVEKIPKIGKIPRATGEPLGGKAGQGRV